METNVLYKRTKNQAIQTWQIFIDGDSFFTREGILGGKITQSKPTKCKAKSIGRVNETTPEQQAVKEAKSKIDKKLKHGYTEDIDEIDNVDMFYEPMLAKKYQDYKDVLKFPLKINFKLDGLRCVTNHIGGKTRNGEIYQSIPHITHALKCVFEFDKLALLDGELYNHEFHDDFSKIQSLATKKKLSIPDIMRTAELLQYHIYDVPRFGKYDETDKFSDRFFEFKDFYDKHPEIHHCIKLVPAYTVNNFEEIDTYLEKFLKDGYEGAIIRIDAGYENKRSKNLLKYKKFIDEEFKILDILAGKGNKAGMAAKMTFRSASGNLFNSNIKGKHEWLKEVLKRKEELIGKMATVQYFNLTPDKQVPRFPYVVKIDRCDI